MKRTRLAPALLASSLLAVGGWVSAQQQTAPPGAPPAAGAPRTGPAPDSSRPADARSSAAMPSGMSGADRADWDRRHRASKIIGTDVRNSQGEKIGDIEDLVLDENGNTQVAIVSTGGFLGIGDSLHAVPWAELKLATDEKNRGARVLDISKEQLKEIPGFSSKEWPNFADPEWAKKNRGLYSR